jgi:Fic family protein
MKIPDTPPTVSSLMKSVTPERLMQLMLTRPVSEAQRAYLHWDELRYRTAPAGLSVDEWWLMLKMGRLSVARGLPFLDKQGHAFSYVLAEPVLKSLRFVDRHAGGAVWIENPVVNAAERDRYLVSSLMEEAITSSQLEGASTSRRVAEDMLRSARKPVDAAERMIFNNFAAMQHIRDIANEPLSPQMLLNLHAMLTQGTLENPADEGRFRRDDAVKVMDNRNGNILHTPPAAAELSARLERLCEFANGTEDDEPSVHPVIRAILLHFMLAYDHPFADGNGRAARALFYWSMLRQGYWLMEFVSISSVLRKAPAQYARAYLHTESDGGDVTYFMLHQLSVIEQSLVALKTYVQQRGQEARQVEQTLHALDANVDLNVRQLALLAGALKQRSNRYTVESHKRSHNVAYATARADLLALTELGLLEQRKRGRAWEFLAPTDLAERMAAATHGE